MSNDNKIEINQNNNLTEESKGEAEVQQNKSIKMKIANKNSIPKETTENIVKRDNSKQKNEEVSEKNLNMGEKQKNKENIKLIIKEQNELLTKEREYLKIVENLKLKIKNLEQSNKNEIDKITTENNEKENRIQILSSTNEKMKQSYNTLLQRMDKIKKNMNKKLEPIQKTTPQQKSPENNEMEQKIYEKDIEIKKKQKLINILSKENQNMKQSIDRYYDLDANKNITKELKEKAQLKNKLEAEIKECEKIVDIHNKECDTTILNLRNELTEIERKLEKENVDFHNKNKDYIYKQCKFSLFNKEDEEEYIKLKNKKNYLDMNKHMDFINYYNRESDILKLYNKKKEFSRDLERGIKKNYERSTSLPKIDVNNEKKVISSLFTQEELLNLQDLFMEEYQDENKLELFMNKINELEKGYNIKEKAAVDDLKEECIKIEKQIKENNEIITMEEFKLKETNIEISELNKKYKILLKKNLLLKKEETKLKTDINEKNIQKLKEIERDKQREEIDNMINDINNININEENSSGFGKSSSNNPKYFSNEENNIESRNEDNINNEEVQVNDDIYGNEEENKDQHFMDNKGEEGNKEEEEELGKREEEGRDYDYGEEEGQEEEGREEGGEEGEYNDGQE